MINSSNNYTYEIGITAQKLHNSLGTKQDRLRLMKGNDRYAVAAKQMHFNSDTDAKLGWWDKKFNILVETKDEHNNTTWYKVNKNSLIKRLGLTEPLNVDAKGVCTNFNVLVDSKLKNLNDLKNVSKPAVRDADSTFSPIELQVLHQLVGVDLGEDSQIIFCNRDDVRSEDDTRDAIDRIKAESLQQYSWTPTLVVNYSRDKQDLNFDKGARLDDSINWIRHMDIDSKVYEKILDGHPIPDNLLESISLAPLNKNQEGFQIFIGDVTAKIDASWSRSHLEAVVNDYAAEIQDWTSPKKLVITSDIESDESAAIKVDIKDASALLEKLKTGLSPLSLNGEKFRIIISAQADYEIDSSWPRFHIEKLMREEAVKALKKNSSAEMFIFMKDSTEESSNQKDSTEESSNQKASFRVATHLPRIQLSNELFISEGMKAIEKLIADSKKDMDRTAEQKKMRNL